MSETSYLGLFKHDNPATNTNKFDIETALNENWDKIDENASSTHEETNIDMQTNTAKELEITDSANAIASFNKVEGDTYQATRSGKNLINIYDLFEVGYTETKSGVTMTILENGGIKFNGTATSNASWPLEGTYQSGITKIAFNGDYVQSGLANNIGINYYSGTTRLGTFSNNTTRNVNANCDYAIIAVTNGVTYDNAVCYPQLEQGTTPTEYEEYGVSPSPDYPSDIRNVGDNNVFDGLFLQGYRSGNANWGTPTSDTQNIVSQNKIFVNYGNNYKFTNTQNKALFQVNLYKSDGTIIGYFNNTKLTNNTIKLDGTETLSGGSGIITDVSFISIQIKDTNGITPSDVTNAKLLSNSIDFKVETKNKFSSEMELGTINNSGVPSSSNDAIRTKNFIEVEPNTTYTISNNKNYYIYPYEYNNNQQFIIRDASIQGKTTITTTSTTKYLKVRTNAGTIENDLTSLWQLEKGTEATQYVPHQEQNIHFPLAEGQLLHKGDYLADDGIHSTRRTIKLAISDMNNSESYPGWNNTPYIQNDYPEKNGYLNVVTNYLSNISTENSDGISINTTNDKNVLFLSTNIFNLTQTQWKSQYPNLMFELQYELAEEIVTPYTTEQAEAYYKLKHFLTYEGYTLIECIDNMKPDIQVNYLYNNKVNNYYGNIIYELENRLHQLENS